MNSHLVVITENASLDMNPRSRTWVYINEILSRAGLWFDSKTTGQIPLLCRDSSAILILAGDFRLNASQRTSLKNWVGRGGSLISMGGTSGLDEVFGVSATRPLAEGWMKVTATNHPMVSGLRSSLHVFGGCAATISQGATLAQIESGKQGPTGSAIVENRFGNGRAVLLAPDLLFSIVHIQQGIPVFQDGKPSPDGSAPINDGMLKAEDGLVLDWERDRSPMQPDGTPVFLEPITDELREIILRSIFHLARERDIALPMLWYWPRGLKAVGHISHDTDENEPDKAWAMLDALNRCGIKSTWCTLYPGGYPKKFYTALKKQDFEIALHYDAMSGGVRALWSKENFVFQHRWLMKEAGLKRIVTNKNHYTRWENRLDFLRWCEEVGIQSDQTRGPSKKGCIGFPLGGSQPYFPLDDEATKLRFLDVLEVNMLTQDLAHVCPAEYGAQLVDSVLRHHGVAHFLFHPAHILKPPVADALAALVKYGNSKGLEWWTSEQIVEWESQRRGVTAKFSAQGIFQLRSAKPLRDATLLMLKSPKRPLGITVNRAVPKIKSWTLHGFEFDAVTLDITPKTEVRLL